MSTPRLAIWFLPEDYSSIRELARGKSDLADTFDEWLQGARDEVARLEREGLAVEKVVVRPDEFAAWCKIGRFEEGFYTMAQFAAEKFHRTKSE
jgi:hypothetical protein